MTEIHQYSRMRHQAVHADEKRKQLFELIASFSMAVFFIGLWVNAAPANWLAQVLLEHWRVVTIVSALAWAMNGLIGDSDVKAESAVANFD